MGKRLIFNLLRAEYLMEKYLKKRVKECEIDVSAGQSGVLFLLKEKEMTMGELVSGLMINNSAVTRLVDGLEEKGLIKRKYSKKDRRKCLVVLTEKGDKAVLQLSSIAAKVNQLAGEGFTDKEIDIFLEVLKSIQYKFG